MAESDNEPRESGPGRDPGKVIFKLSSAAEGHDPIGESIAKFATQTSQSIAAAMSVPTEKIARILRSATIATSPSPSTFGTFGSYPWSRDYKGVQPQLTTLQQEIAKLQKDVVDKKEAWEKAVQDGEQSNVQAIALEAQVQELQKKLNMKWVADRVHPKAQQLLFNSREFLAQFLEANTCEAYVLSVDIRRSTELMLNARQPQQYAEFIISLAKGLRNIVIENRGVFDKFTGDGVLAFFPKFYSGPDSGFRALRAAHECHEFFESEYRNHRHCFRVVLKQTGLGIGIDFGTVHVVQFAGEFTVVGAPVVYACRMGGADAGRTFVNQPAYEQLFKEYSAYCDFEETELDMKHGGASVAYRAKLNSKQYRPKTSPWEEKEDQQVDASDGEACGSGAHRWAV
jgi:class 3 adenylate cyclase